MKIIETHQHGDSYAIASDIRDTETNQPSVANANLIAAAPILLQVLQSALSVGQIVGCSKVAAMKAVKAAFGQNSQDH